MDEPDDDMDCDNEDGLKPSNGETIHAFLEALSGRLIHFTRKWSMWLAAHGFWNEHIPKDLDTMPQNFSQTGTTLRKGFRKAMEKDFPELHLCNDHWKTDQIWKLNYHSWKTPIVNKLKAEAPTKKTPVQSGNKRKQSDNDSDNDEKSNSEPVAKKV